MASTTTSVDLDYTEESTESQQIMETLPQHHPKFPLAISPEECPVSWTVLNNSLAVSGCLLLFDMMYSYSDATERPFARAFHLLWEFSTCFFWTLETSLSTAYQYHHLHRRNLAWYTKLEIVIAAYFTATTFWELMQWHVMGEQPLSKFDIVEVALDTSFYVYLSIRSLQRVFSVQRPTGADVALQIPFQRLDDVDASNEQNGEHPVLEDHHSIV